MDEILQSVETVQWVTDFGSKFVADDQVCLGGFDKCREELTLIQNLVIAANGPSRIAAQYGAYIMKHLRVFNSVQVYEANVLEKQDLMRVKFAGYLTLSQSGESKSLIKGVKDAISLGITCMNVVNVEDSPLTRVTCEFQDEFFDSENIGMYMKSGFCFSDVKSFIPEVISMALVALWFSHTKQANLDKEIFAKRQKLIREINSLPEKLQSLTQDKVYEQVSEMLKTQHNLFILAKGLGHFIGGYMAQKFL